MLIKGPAGDIEAQWDEVAGALGTAILCHPHPQFGGSMHDGILSLVSTTFRQHGINCLRFNFRGVGDSAGEFDNGVGEVDDLLAVSHWLWNEKPSQKPWLMGYSFGANIVWQCLSKVTGEQIAGVLLIAPPVGRMQFPHNNALPCPVFAIAGDCDDFVESQTFRDWSGVNTSIIEGADHFFTGTSTQLTSAMRDILENCQSGKPGGRDIGGVNINMPD